MPVKIIPCAEPEQMPAIKKIPEREKIRSEKKIQDFKDGLLLATGPGV
jgi:hypothetical protein